jgi:hypothetical protein
LGNHSRNTPPTMKGRLSFPSKSTDTLPSTPFFYNFYVNDIGQTFVSFFVAI